jgi:hypothetical protein
MAINYSLIDFFEACRSKAPANAGRGVHSIQSMSLAGQSPQGCQELKTRIYSSATLTKKT